MAGHPDSKWTDIVDDVISECVYSSYNPDGVGVLVFKSCNDDGYIHNDNTVIYLTLLNIFTSIFLDKLNLVMVDWF